ncbi:MAG: glycosyltransferase family 87 protein [Ancalomicrobiaceae bacterium]|nr:glycosyltransferase family 87 protein [Ancalomicrobiaceae bacterium]
MANRIAFFRRADWLHAGRITAYARIFVAVLVLAAIGWVAASKGLIDPAGHPIGTDFLDVYAAGLMARAGHAAQAYDWQAHGAVEASIVAFDGYYGWHYPPMFLFLAEPLAALPYLAALGLYLAATFALYLAAMPMLAPRPASAATSWPAAAPLWWAAGFPAVFVNLGHGQNGFLTTALLAGGLASMPKRPIVAGVLFGCLAYKPQFAVLIPVALLAGRQWKTFAVAAVTAGLLALASLAVFGPDTWRAFFASLQTTRTIVLEQGATGWPKIVSAFSAVRILGGGIAAAYAVQTATTLVAVAAVAWVWVRRPNSALAAGLTALAVPLTTPYVLDYDLMVLAPAVVLLARSGLETGFRPWEKLCLALVTLSPLIARAIGTGLGLPIVPEILLLTLAVFLRRMGDDPESRAPQQPG